MQFFFYLLRNFSSKLIKQSLTYQRKLEGTTQHPETVWFPPVCQLAAV